MVEGILLSWQCQRYRYHNKSVTMLTKNRYSIKDMLLWTRWETLFFLLLAFVVVILYEYFGLSFLKVPWTPVALIGTAVAFIIGFQNSAAYGRIWEARKIWGGIVNSSRTWGMKIQDMITDEHASHAPVSNELAIEKKTMIYRHIAWLNALRHAMRSSRKWEKFQAHHTNREWSKRIKIPEMNTSLEADLQSYLSDNELEYTLNKNNKAAAILFLQSAHLRRLKEKGYLWEFSFLELENLLEELFTLQGKSERIKNFPYPRQYATLSYYFVWIFLILLPFGLVPEFAKFGESIMAQLNTQVNHFVWISVPFCGAVSWVFHTMMRIGTVGENPFEGSANDVPISTISRGIEIDLRQLLGEADELIPRQHPEVMHVQM